MCMDRWIGLLVVLGLLLGGCSNGKDVSQANETTITVSSTQPSPDEVIQKELNEVVSLIKDRRYYEAIKQLSSSEHYQTVLDYEVLVNYATSLQLEKKNGHPRSDLLIKIPDDYTGVMADEITEHLKKHEKALKEYKQVMGKVAEQERNQKVEPKVGMTVTEVLNSTWGKPSDINKKTTANSVNEQWVYGVGKYIYIENGKVIAIQE